MGCITATSIRIETLEEKQSYPFGDESDDDFMFTGDLNGNFIKALRENNIKLLPKLHIQTLYKNIIGGCFIIKNTYRIYPKDEEQDTVLSNWLAQITSFPIKYKKDLDRLITDRKLNSDEKDVIYSKMEEDFKNSILGDDDIKKNDVCAWALPGASEIHPITEEEYNKYLKDSKYGVRLPPSGPCIVTKENNKK